MTNTTTAPLPAATSDVSPPAARPAASVVVGWLRRTPGDLLYLLTGLPVAAVSAAVLWSLASLVTSLVSSVVLIPVAIIALLATLACARAFAHVERFRLAWTGERIPAPRPAGSPLTPPAPTRTGPWWRWWDWLRDGQLWLDLLHGSIAVALATITWSITVAWLVTGLTAVSWWSWGERAQAAVAPGRVSIAGIDALPVVWQVLVGLALLVTLVPVVRGLAFAHAVFARGTIGNSSVRALAQRVEVLTASRAAASDAEAAALRSLERDLHDGPQQRLVRLEMDLAATQRRLAAGDAEAAATALAEARQQAQEALAELRALSRGIAPPVLADRGLVAAVESLASRSAVPATVRAGALGALPGGVERAAYFVVAEALTNAAKHSGARAAVVDLTVRAEPEGRWLVVRVEDDGVGGADPSSPTGTGLRGLVARAQAVDGALTVASPAGGPTVVEARLPLP
ncbi:Signal transduction histidine kinase [Quadrisphaera granulorum]|uniref:histidine kinase n=1 Tax=Quadrisphaera granulorum TaxID=317664 RepID=A0A316A794_9ACTN|nr:sensor domain-containing protein [Quadrisphaera granulorum]PWJ53319.1 signal transduction histidine kinase [Quadrisphaera granulorum]SZE96993.1 Signal transduction histidine kinase [Quadrisphaera granulorum]